MLNSRNVSAACLLFFAFPVFGEEYDLPANILPPGVNRDSVVGVSPTFEAPLSDLLQGNGLSILQQTHPDYVPLSGARQGGIWLKNWDGHTTSNDRHTTSNYMYVTDANGNTVCILVSSSVPQPME
jgi:hypothetical protein